MTNTLRKKHVTRSQNAKGKTRHKHILLQKFIVLNQNQSDNKLPCLVGQPTGMMSSNDHWLILVASARSDPIRLDIGMLGV